MDYATTDLVLAIVHHLLVFMLAGILMTHGLLASSGQQAFIEGFISVALTIASAAWTWYDTQGRQMVKDSATIMQVRLAQQATAARTKTIISPASVAEKQQSGGR